MRAVQLISMYLQMVHLSLQGGPLDRSVQTSAKNQEDWVGVFRWRVKGRSRGEFFSLIFDQWKGGTSLILSSHWSKFFKKFAKNLTFPVLPYPSSKNINSEFVIFPKHFPLFCIGCPYFLPYHCRSIKRNQHRVGGDNFSKEFVCRGLAL